MHVAFAPFSRWRSAHDPSLPSIDELNAYAREVGLALPDRHRVAFVAAPAERLSAQDYERRIRDHGEIAVRPGSAHDVWNALAWLRFPRVKGLLNALHAAAPRAASGAPRGRDRDAATLLDESGMIVACADESLLALWRDHQWEEVFWKRRLDVANRTRAVAIGHGLLEKLAAPFPGITAKALVVSVDGAMLPGDPGRLAEALDAVAAEKISARGARFAPEDLLPLPVSALPDWNGSGLSAERFADRSVFRLRRATLERAGCGESGGNSGCNDGDYDAGPMGGPSGGPSCDTRASSGGPSKQEGEAA